MPESYENGASEPPIASPKRTEDGRFRKGVSGNASGRPKQDHPLIAALEAIVDKAELAEKLWDMAMAGESWAIKYIYDRLAGLPVQRYEAKLEYQVRERARALAEEHGLSVEDVMKQAESLMRGGGG